MAIQGHFHLDVYHTAIQSPASLLAPPPAAHMTANDPPHLGGERVLRVLGIEVVAYRQGSDAALEATTTELIILR